MPRRKRDDAVLDEVMDTFMDLPFRAGLIVASGLALLGFVLPLVFPQRGLDLAGVLALGGRYVVWGIAFVVLVGSTIGAVGRILDRQRFDSGPPIEQLGWSEFERLLAEYYRRLGERVTQRGGGGADGGVDLVLDGPSGRRVVQAKHWRARTVGVVPLRALWGVLEDEGATGAVFVTSGSFTPDARAFATGKQLELIDGGRLRRLIAEVKGEGRLEPARVTAPERCPQCGEGTLVRRQARRGPNAGSSFWGCSRFPTCRYIRNV